MNQGIYLALSRIVWGKKYLIHAYLVINGKAQIYNEEYDEVT